MAWIVVGALALAAAAFGEVSFNRDIRPIMADTCFRCHGPDQRARMAGLRLDIRDEALKTTPTGATPVVPGNPDASAIVQRVFAKEPARLMPPVYSHKVLNEEQKQKIRQWVQEGAKYEGHWSYLPLKRPAAPAGAGVHPIDGFVRARLAREGLKPSPEADRRTLIRRVTLDLTGLPPTPAQIAAFVNDRSANAYDKLVDRLLSSPRYAEKQAMHWLDAARYADTAGFHGDNPIPVWPYRDYVLRAFRDNKPFDVFTREQLAGDLLPEASDEQKVASAFNRLNRISAEGGVQPKEYLAKYGADRVRTVSAIWLAGTLGCAECHDHKFDPYTARDFYSMKAFFADILETGLVPDRGARAWGSQLDLPGPEQQRKREQLHWQLTKSRGELEAAGQILFVQDEEWDKEILRLYDAGELRWHVQPPVEARAANGAELTVYNEPVDENDEARDAQGAEKKPGNGLIIAGGPNPDNETYSVVIRPGGGNWTALGIELDADLSLPGHGLARGAERVVVTEVEAELNGQKLPFAFASSNPGGMTAALQPIAAIDGDPRTGWGVVGPGPNSNVFLALRFASPVHTEAGAAITVRLRQDSEVRRATVGRFRIMLSSGVYSWPVTSEGRRRGSETTPADVDKSGISRTILRALRTDSEKRTEIQNKALLDYYLWLSPHLQGRNIEVARLDAELGRLEASIPRVMVTESAPPRVTRVLGRGNWMDDTGAVVEPAVPGFLRGIEASGGRATRLDLANWLVSRENPLAARAFVNRTWRQLFGTGLSRVLEDLGSQGEWPSHTELLDWLAAEFVEPSWKSAGTHRWDMKHLLRTMVTSGTYRQSSKAGSEVLERDPENRLLARQSRFRVDAEGVRDIALAVSGLLAEKFGGPSVKPYQPDGYLAALNFPTREYAASRGDDLYRRGLYTFWQRTFLHPSMATFDAPTREECTVNRASSNTPLQALVLLNDPIFVEASRVFAQNMLKDGGSGLRSRVEWAFMRAVGRPASAAERGVLEDLYRGSLARFRESPAAARALVEVGESAVSSDEAELAAMATVARAILNLHETTARN